MTEGKGFKSAKNRVKVKGKVIDGEHEQYALTYGMMLGISVSVRIGAKRDASHPDQLRLSDFQEMPDWHVLRVSGEVRHLGLIEQRRSASCLSCS